MVPLLFSRVTNVMSIYVTGIGRLVFSWLFTSLHYIFVDKDKYMTKLRQRQLNRERMDCTVGAILLMNIQVVLQIIFLECSFPQMITLIFVDAIHSLLMYSL